jgi:hypothetical protein
MEETNVPWYGDFPEHVLFNYFKDMSTVIVRINAIDGIVVGADGRRTKPPNDQFDSDGAQKIFPIVSDNKKLSYSICGTTLFTAIETGDVLWDLHAQIEEAVTVVPSSQPHLFGFAQAIARPIYRALQSASKFARLVFPEESEQKEAYGINIANVLIDGYYKGFPDHARIRFFHHQQKLCNPQVFKVEFETVYLHGPKSIWDAFENVKDKRLKIYRPKGYNKAEPWRIPEAVAIAAGYVKACSSPEGLEIDRRYEKTIGGRTHIAIVTPDGFRWAEGYDPAC